MASGSTNGEGVYVVIPVFNGWEQTELCLRSIEDSSYAVTAVVVDHGSTDATRTELPRMFPNVVHLLDSDELWWTGATNRGIRCALSSGASHVALLNSDCEV